MARRRDYRPGGKKARSKGRTLDGFDNMAAHLGLGQSNPLAGSTYKRNVPLTAQRTVLDAMYRTSWVVGRMVDVVAEDMVRGGIDVQSELTPGEVDELMRYMRRMGVYARLSDTLKWSRLYGGAMAVMLIDGADNATPLRLEEITQDSFKGLYVLDRYQVIPGSELVTDLGPGMGYPAYYTINNDAALTGTYKVHASRVLRFVGIELPWQERVSEQHWGASVVERAYERILALDSSTHGSANMMLRGFLRTIGIKGLREILAAGGKAEKALYRMFDAIRYMQTSEGITLLDAEDIFQTHNWTFAGVYDALQAFAEQIAGATGIPLVRLLGQSPKGFSTGEADLRMYYDTILTAQDNALRPIIETLLPVMSMSLWGKPLPAGTQFDFRSLWQPTEMDKATIATNDAQSVAGLYGAGLINDEQALTELRDAGRVTGRWTGIRDKDIEQARGLVAAPNIEDMP